MSPNKQQKFPFDLDKTTGQIWLKSQLDFEQQQQREFNLSIVAELEMGNTQKSVRLQSAPLDVRIIVEDSNDNCPLFMEIPLGNLLQLEERHLKPKTPSDTIIWKAKVDQVKNI